MIKIKRGLDLPIKGAPADVITEKKVNSIAVLGIDYIGMKPKMNVEAGDSVKCGETIFFAKKYPEIKFTAPGSGKIRAINRGDRRALLSVVIDLDSSEEYIEFKKYSSAQLNSLSEEEVKNGLLESGMWTALKVRPFSKIVDPSIKPASIFVNAMDTNPLAPNMSKVLEGKENSLINGLKVISKLTDGKVFFVKSPSLAVNVGDVEKVHVEEFTGPHPAGLPGTHIHFLDPVNSTKNVFQIDAQDVAAIGDLFTTGKLNNERIISFAGPSVEKPRMIKTRIGASIDDIVARELVEGNHRVISGSVLSGFHAKDALAYLGRFHRQISVVEEGTERHFLGWVAPGMDEFSVKRTFLSALAPGKKFNFNTNLKGGHRAIVPVESYEQVMPLDILPTFLLRALAVDDIEDSEKLGALELEEEDLALCTFVCPAKIDHMENLRRNLNLIEKEG
ncbi:MAG: Na(+)-translocating NADH-quinone reductase subunit A [Chlorobi bacterium]|nr:Na(+)-translocating NADH-quinone reductase subunit A [Chlorobiota bacterium]